MRTLPIILAIVLASPFSALAAKVNKCTDEQGRITYTDLPCAHVTHAREKVSISDNKIDGTQYRDRLQKIETEKENERLAEQQYRERKQEGLWASQQKDNYENMNKQQEKICEAVMDSAGKNKRGMTRAQVEALALCAGKEAPIQAKKPKIMPPLPKPPRIITDCDQSGCWDNMGMRYNKGAGATHFDTNGKVCQQLPDGSMLCP